MSQQDSVKWVCQAYPQRVKALLESLDLGRPGLEAVRSAAQSGDIEAAGEALLKYYRSGSSAKWLRADRAKAATAPSTNPNTKVADAILDDTFTFYEQTDRVPRRPDGGWQWSHKGPANDQQWAMAFNRHFHLDVLLNAYLATGDAKYAARLDALVRDWIVTSLPYPAKKNSTETWGGLEVSFRVKAWARAFYGLQSCEQFTPATRLLILTSLPEHADYARRFHAPSSNWTTMELSGLAMVAAAWPEFKESAQWMDYAGRTLAAELHNQVYPDGVQKELTAGYHMVALNNFELLAQLCREASLPLPDGYAAGLEATWNYLAWSMRPDGYGPMNNDSDLPLTRPPVIKAAATLNRPDWLYIASNGREGDRPKAGPSIVFPWAGQAILRSGYDADALWAFFDMGPWGTAHQHNDKLHVSMVAFGRDLLVDGGRFNYIRGEGTWRTSYAQTSLSHNVLMLDGQGQAPGPKATSQPTAKTDYAVGGEIEFARGSCDHFDKIEGSATHTRVVVQLPGEVVVVADRLESDHPRQVSAMWHWHSDCTVASKDGQILSTDAGKANLRIAPVAGFKWNIELVKGQKAPHIQGWYSPRYNEWAPSTAAVLSARVEGNAAFAWILAPAKGPAPDASGQIVSSSNDAIELLVTVGSAKPVRLYIPWAHAAPQIETP